ncbi:MAG: MATE family efflux transporter [Lachnospiraceae bacterium]|nr:MATE family efflux transporter [Lachnospiraceae bacterium]
MKENDFTRGPIVPSLLKFMGPVLFAMFLQAMYGAVDLLVVGRFGVTADVSGVATGSQIIQALTHLVIGLAMGITVAVGLCIGRKESGRAGGIIGTGIIIFTIVGVLFTVICVAGAGPLASLLQAPEEAFETTSAYVRICGGGFLVIVAYNLLGSVFRGLGDSKTPLLAVGIACVFNILGDYFFVAILHMGAAGAAIATVAAQFLSVVISFFILRGRELPFTIARSDIRLDAGYTKMILRIGVPVAIQDFLVSVSFLVLMAIVNQLGVVASAGVGVAQKVCMFIMLVPSSFMHSMSSFIAQNRGAGLYDRAYNALKDGIIVSVFFGVVMFVIAFFFGDHLAGIFSQDGPTVVASWDYLKAYAIDCLLTCFLFCFIGYFNGIEKTTFVLIQGLIGAFAVRIPVAFLMSRIGGGSLFMIGLAIPCSTVVQIILCLFALRAFRREDAEKIAGRTAGMGREDVIER